MSSRAVVVCGVCSVAPDVITDLKGKDRAVCPNCGRSDDAKIAVKIAKEHLAHESAKFMQDNAPASASRNKFQKFEPSPLTPQTFRWHAVEG